MKMGDRVTLKVHGVCCGEGVIADFPEKSAIQVDWHSREPSRSVHPKRSFHSDGQGGYVVVLP